MGASRIWKLARLGLAIAVSGCMATEATDLASTSPTPLARAIAALGGGDALGQASALTIEQRGLSFPNEQAVDPAEQIGRAERYYRWRFDAPGDRLVRDAEQIFPGAIRFWSRSVLGPDGGWNVDLLRWRTGDDLQTFPATEALRQRLAWERVLPHLLLQQAQDATDLKLTDGGFSFTDAAGAAVEVRLDPETGRPDSSSQIIFGAPVEYRYSNYERRHGVLMPATVQTFGGGRVTEEVRMVSTSLGRIADADLSPPSGYAPPPASGQPVAREIAPGVLFFDNMPTGYHSMAVDAGDHFVVIESPSNPDYAQRQKALLEERSPGKPVRFVLTTHMHGDHAGGLSVWAESGATLVVASGARVAVERQLRARGFTGQVNIEEISDKRSFGSGPAMIDAYRIASAHNASNLIMHVPAAGVLFQGDFFYVPERGAPPAQFQIAEDLKSAIRRLGLRVEQVAGAHGRLATGSELSALRN